VHLKGLSGLKTLYLGGTQVTDSGLVHIRGLTDMWELTLYSTRVTDTGVAGLQKALPKCRINKYPSSLHPRCPTPGGVVRIWRLPPVS